MDWDTAVIRAMNISEITRQDYGVTYIYSFGENGKLEQYIQIEDGHYETRTILIEYYPTGKIKNYRTYWSICDYKQDSIRGKLNEYHIPICFDLLNDLSILDTNKAEKVTVAKGWKNIYGDFWKQELMYQSHKINIHYQINNLGELFFMKWSTADNYIWDGPNRSILNYKMSFDTNGAISELIIFDNTGSELMSYADTIYHMTFANVNGYPRCTKKIIWDGDGYDPVIRVYEAFDTDNEPGIDTAYFLLEQSKYQNWNSSYYYQPFAESFNYLPSGKIEKKTYFNQYWKYTLNDQGELIDTKIIDSIYLDNITRFLPNNYFEAAVLERFTKEYNTLESCRSCRFPNFTDVFLFSLVHNKNELYLDENWINDPNVKCDSSVVIQPTPIMTGREYKKWLKNSVESTREILNDTSKYTVSYY